MNDWREEEVVSHNARVEAAPDVLTADEVAKLLRTSRRTVERTPFKRVKVGRLVRYLREDVLAYLREKAS